MKRLRAWIGGLLLLAGGLSVGYLVGRRPPAQGRSAAVGASPVVATFQGGAVTADELRAAIEEQGPLLRESSASAAGRRRLAEELVRQKLMERDAAAKGYDRDPEFLREQRHALAALYARKELEEPAARRSPSDADLQAYLDRHKAEYAQPERVRIAHIFLAAPADVGAARERKLDEARALLQKLRSGHDYYAFATAARERSDDVATKGFGGDLPLLTRAELESRLGGEVAAAAFELRGTEALADHVVEARGGFHLLKLRTRVEAANADLASLRSVLRGRVAAELRSGDERAFFDALEKAAGVHFDDAALAAVQVSPGSGGTAGAAGRPASSR
jgi:parvulin-like peptidyl-prolyl isomerase